MHLGNLKTTTLSYLSRSVSLAPVSGKQNEEPRFELTKALKENSTNILTFFCPCEISNTSERRASQMVLVSLGCRHQMSSDVQDIGGLGPSPSGC